MTTALSILFGLSRGLHEGMIMTEGGVRENEAFYLYHFLGVLVYIAFGYLIYLVTMKHRWPRILYMIGMLFIIWECTEIGYSVAKSNTFIHNYEHVVFADLYSFYIYGWYVYLLHAFRTVMATIFIITGGK